MARGRWLSEEEKARIIEMYRSGMSATRIAKDMERGVKSINRVLKPPEEPAATISLSDFPSPMESEASALESSCYSELFSMPAISTMGFQPQVQQAPAYNPCYQTDSHIPSSAYQPSETNQATPSMMGYAVAPGQAWPQYNVQNQGYVAQAKPVAPIQEPASRLAPPEKRQQERVPLSDISNATSRVELKSCREQANLNKPKVDAAKARKAETQKHEKNKMASGMTQGQQMDQGENSSSVPVRRPPRLVEPVPMSQEQPESPAPTETKDRAPSTNTRSDEKKTPPVIVSPQSLVSERVVHRVESAPSSQSESEASSCKKRKTDDHDEAQPWKRSFANAMSMLESAVWNLKQSSPTNVFDDRLCLLIERFQVEISLHELDKKHARQSSQA